MWSSKTYTFSPSTTAKSAEVNQNFDDMVNGLDTAMPSGGIIAWSGSIGTIPSGWYLCNGSNSTPDLRDRFVVGAGSTYAVDATGGEATHTLTTAEMPIHTHVQNAHTHVQNQHRHSYSAGDGTAASGYAADTSTYDKTQYSNYTTPTNQNTTAVNQNAGSGSAHENRPPYYALAFIQKS